jgi:hypothetical protein
MTRSIFALSLGLLTLLPAAVADAAPSNGFDTLLVVDSPLIASLETHVVQIDFGAIATQANTFAVPTALTKMGLQSWQPSPSGQEVQNPIDPVTFADGVLQALCGGGPCAHVELKDPLSYAALGGGTLVTIDLTQQSAGISRALPVVRIALPALPEWPEPDQWWPDPDKWYPDPDSWYPEPDSWYDQPDDWWPAIFAVFGQESVHSMVEVLVDGSTAIEGPLVQVNGVDFDLNELSDGWLPGVVVLIEEG